MVFKCCVPFCSNTNRDTKMHRFPYLDEEAYDIWLDRICNEKLRDIHPMQVYNNFRICHHHFSKDCIIVDPGRKILKYRSLPTIGLPDFDETPTADNSFLTSNTKRNKELKTGPQPGPSRQIDNDEGDITNQPSFEVAAPQALFEIQDIASDIDIETPTRQVVQTSPPHAPKSRQDLRRPLSLLPSVSVIRAVDLPPKPQELYRIAIKLRRISKELFNENASTKRRLQKASEFIQTEEYVKSTMHKTSFDFIMSQLKLPEMKPKCPPLTLEDKVLALTLCKQGERNYNLLERIFALPSKQMLKKLLEEVPIHCSINQTIIDALKNEVSKMAKADKYCTILFDEISITPNLQFYKKFHIEGSQDFGRGERSKFADRAMVFMARGIQRNWKQPLCFYFVESGMKQVQLIKTLKMVIRSVRQTGLKVIATVCGQSTKNVQAIEELKRLTSEECLKSGEEYFGFEVDGEEVVPLYDVPHLLKGLRNRTMNADKVTFQWNKTPEQTATWNTLIKAYEWDCGSSEYRMLYKLTDSHIYVDKIDKTQVSLAAQVFSQRVAMTIGGMSRLGLKLPEAEGTADFILFIDKLFDSVNGVAINPSKGKELRSAVKENSGHIEFWHEAIKVLKTIRFHKGREQSVSPSIKNWIHTLEGFIYLWSWLKLENFTFMATKNFNQDSLENFFVILKVME